MADNSGNKERKQPVSDREIPNNPDAKIDQDFPGYPHAPSEKKLVKPETRGEKELADLHEKDGEKRSYGSSDKNDSDESGEIKDDGSAGAFIQTENPDD